MFMAFWSHHDDILMAVVDLLTHSGREMKVFLKNKRTAWRVFLLVTGMVGVAPVHAERMNDNRLIWTAAVGGEVRWFDWREHQDDKQLLMEAGPLATLAGQLQLQYGPVVTRLDVQGGGGLARYDGHLQSGPAYQADAWENIMDGEWRVGWQAARASVHAGFMQRDWRRYIEGNVGVSSAEERYRWRLLTLGGEYQMDFPLQWQMAVAVNVGGPIGRYQKIYATYYDSFSLRPGSGAYWRIALPLQGRGDHANFSIEPYYQQQTVQRSNSVALTHDGVPQSLLAYQPASIRREVGVTVLWRFAGSAKTTP